MGAALLRNTCINAFLISSNFVSLKQQTGIETPPFAKEWLNVSSFWEQLYGNRTVSGSTVVNLFDLNIFQVKRP